MLSAFCALSQRPDMFTGTHPHDQERAMLQSLTSATDRTPDYTRIQTANRRVEPWKPMSTTAAYPENRTHPGGPVIGRRLSFGSVNEGGARFTAMMMKPDIVARGASRLLRSVHSSGAGFFPLPSRSRYPGGAIFRGRPNRAEGAFARICAHRACGNLDARAGFVPHFPAFPVRAD